MKYNSSRSIAMSNSQESTNGLRKRSSMVNNQLTDLISKKDSVLEQRSTYSPTKKIDSPKSYHEIIERAFEALTNKIFRSFNKELKERMNKIERKMANIKGRITNLQIVLKNRKSSRRSGSKLSEVM